MLISKEHLPEIEDKIQEIEALLETKDDASFGGDSILPDQCDITTFGAALKVDGLVRRLNSGEILMPPLPRNYVWTLEQASRFIESLLLGFPVPGIFLARESDSGKLLVIDGQQRLKTLQFFYAGYFNLQNDETEPQVFSLSMVQRQLNGKTYQTLQEIKKWHLDKTTIHATIVKQDFPRYDDTTLCHIFERLNSGGKHLTPQEIRATLYHGNLMDFIKKLNQLPNWRNLFGKPSVSLKDQELILRFLAFYFDDDEYAPPMKEFLNQFAHQNRQLYDEFFAKAERAFSNAIDVIWQNVGASAFRLKQKKLLNTAMFDSVMVGLARAMENPAFDHSQVKTAYDELLNDEAYMAAISNSTSSESRVAIRIEKATEKFKQASAAD
ncbi:MAG: DUF262 domain-containing protein [Candidatus Parabeggiatoa sp. nov. 1]|nr:MAG: DUF262 domain-containing protein [Gammaproteobacteria bacterium]